MELSVLNSTFKRSKLIESWSSLVWTERYATNGEFELVSNNVSDILTLLPLGGPLDPPCVVALRDSTVPMIVETHKIEQSSTGPTKITTTGRSFETFLENRTTLNKIVSSTARIPWVVSAASPSDAAWYVMDQIITKHVADPADAIPEIVILDNVPEAWPEGTASYTVEPKDLYSWVIDTLQIGEHGFKSTLPSSSGNQIGISIYSGTDRRTTVVFDAKLDQFNNKTHLLSKLGHKNTMVTAGANGLDFGTNGTTTSGLARRVDYQDMTREITLAAGATLTALLKNKSKISLTDKLQTTLFSGEIADRQAAQYGVDYFLGDKVKLSGDYGLSQDVRIAEFVRTQDNAGTRSYPTFAAITP